MKKILVGCLMTALVFLLAASVNFLLTSSLTGVYRSVMSSLLLIDSMIYLLLIVLRNIQEKWVRIFWVCVVIGNIILTLFDELGLADFLFMALNLLILLLYSFIHYKEDRQAHLRD